jgi:hypothetical protein
MDFDNNILLFVSIIILELNYLKSQNFHFKRGV